VKDGKNALLPNYEADLHHLNGANTHQKLLPGQRSEQPLPGSNRDKPSSHCKKRHCLKASN
jgi:hypothetical protein